MDSYFIGNIHKQFQFNLTFGSIIISLRINSELRNYVMTFDMSVVKPKTGLQVTYRQCDVLFTGARLYLMLLSKMPLLLRYLFCVFSDPDFASDRLTSHKKYDFHHCFH